MGSILQKPGTPGPRWFSSQVQPNQLNFIFFLQSAHASKAVRIYVPTIFARHVLAFVNPLCWMNSTEIHWKLYFTLLRNLFFIEHEVPQWSQFPAEVNTQNIDTDEKTAPFFENAQPYIGFHWELATYIVLPHQSWGVLLGDLLKPIFLHRK